MKYLLYTLISTTYVLTNPIYGQQTSFSQEQTQKKAEQTEEAIVYFTPPANWMLADSNALPGRVRTMVIGKGSSGFPPSLNLSSEPYKGTLKQYLKTVKSINDAQGYEWKDLGTIQTQTGAASLSQVDTKTQWGTVRLMHVILVKNENVYILTGSALKDEFSTFYKEFFAAMRSLKINKDIYEAVTNPQQRNQLKTAVENLQTEWKTRLNQKQKENPAMNWEEIKETVFNSKDFQSNAWNPFKEMIKQKYSQLGSEWQSLFSQKMEDELKSRNNNNLYCP